MFVATTSKNQVNLPPPCRNVQLDRLGHFSSTASAAHAPIAIEITVFMNYLQVLVSDPATPYDVITEVRMLLQSLRDVWLMMRS